MKALGAGEAAAAGAERRGPSRATSTRPDVRPRASPRPRRDGEPPHPGRAGARTQPKAPVKRRRRRREPARHRRHRLPRLRARAAARGRAATGCGCCSARPRPSARGARRRGGAAPRSPTTARSRAALDGVERRATTSPARWTSIRGDAAGDVRAARPGRRGGSSRRAPRRGVKRVVLASSSGHHRRLEGGAHRDRGRRLPHRDRRPAGPTTSPRSTRRRRRSGFASDTGLPLVVLNPSLLLGPGDARLSSTDVVFKFLERRIPAMPDGRPLLRGRARRRRRVRRGARARAPRRALPARRRQHDLPRASSAGSSGSRACPRRG